MDNRKVIVYIAMSLDGFIAKPDGDIGWLSSVETKGEDYGYAEFVKTIDTVIMGRKTYDMVQTFGIDLSAAENISYIITRQNLPAKGNVTFYNGEISGLVNELKSHQGKNIFVDGGAEVVNLMLKENLIDEFIISIIPILLGSGIRLFDNDRVESSLRFISSKSFESGLVQLNYQKKKK